MSVRRFIEHAGVFIAGLLVAASGAWAALAVFYAGPQVDSVRNGLCALVAIVSLATLAAFFRPHWRWRAGGVHLLLFIVILGWFCSITPSNQRDWQADAAVLSSASIEGNTVTVRNIRNFEYRSETDYTPSYYDRRFDLGKLEGVDLVASYWMGPAVAHIFLSFDFGVDGHLAVSIETRKEKSESYSTLGGLFRQYELYYAVADERDVIRLRTNVRRDPPEQVYLYRMQGPRANGQRLFLDYMQKLNALVDTPEFYNTLTTNCTTNIWMHTLVNAGHLPFSWKILLSGYVPDYLYEAGRIDQRVAFAEVKARALVNGRAQAADAAADFSRRIRDSDVMPAEQPGTASDRR